MNKRISRMTYSLEPDYQDLFRRITAKTRRSLTDELRLMLDARAETLGIEPINPVDPKSFSPTLEMTIGR